MDRGGVVKGGKPWPGLFMHPYQPEAQARTGERVILACARVGIAQCACYSPRAMNNPDYTAPGPRAPSSI